MYALGKIGGFLHLYIGQEAVAVGATSTLRPDDYAIVVLPRARPLPRQGLGPAPDHGRAVRPHATGSARARAARCTSSTRASTSSAATRIVGAPPAARRGGGLRDQVPGRRPGGAVLLRRRRGARGRVPRVDEPGRAVEAARRSSSARTTATPWAPPSSGRSPRPRSGVRRDLRHAWRGGGRHGRARRARVRGARGRAGAARQDARRSSRRAPTASAATPCAIPAGAVYRTKEEVEREKLRDPIVLFRERCAEGRRRSPRPTSRTIEKEVNDLVDEAVAFAEASPEPPAAGAVHRRVQGLSAMAVMTYREALNLALREEMRRDPRVFVMGEEVGLYEGAYKVTQGLLKEFGPRRIVDTPICRVGLHRGRHGRGHGRAPARGRDDDVQLRHRSPSTRSSTRRPRCYYMSGGQYNVPHRDPRPRRAGRASSPPSTRSDGGVLLPRARAQGRAALHARGRQGPARSRPSATTTRSSSSSRRRSTRSRARCRRTPTS